MDGSDVIGVGLSVKRIQSALVAPFYWPSPVGFCENVDVDQAKPLCMWITYPSGDWISHLRSENIYIYTLVKKGSLDNTLRCTNNTR